MATSEKTILSSLEEAEESCKDEIPAKDTGCCLNGGGGVAADSTIFKAFFESNSDKHQLEKNVSSISSPLCNSKDNEATQEIPKPQVCCNGSDIVPSHSVLAECGGMEVVGTQSLSAQCGNGSSTNLMTENIVKHSPLCSSSVSSKVTLEDSDTFNDDENKGFEIIKLTKLKSDPFGTEYYDANGQDPSQACMTLNGCLSETEHEVFTNKTGDICGKENSTEEKAALGNCTDKLHENDPYMLTEEETLVNGGADGRKPMCDKTENVKKSNHESKSFDPFTLSGDEDFSPKAYKPIKRKLNQASVDLKALNNTDLFDEVDGGEKRQKFIEEEEEDLSLSDMSGRKSVSVAYVYSKELVDKANKLVRIEGRALLVHSLIHVYGILDHVDIIPPRLATETEIVGFHCSEYLDFLKTLKDADDLSDSTSAEAEAYGLSYDCPVQEDVFETASLISGATITAAESLMAGTASIAINWCGGWHHAKRDSASGFCYLNDIVLGILKLREKFDRVLYVDLDLHHGDGVEEAFYMTPKVMTVSFHKHAFGFFPGSGSLSDTGSGRGRLHSVNVPLMDGIGDASFFSVFTSVMKKVKEKFSADAIVIQCGADGLSEDPMASFNLTHVALAKCVCFLLTWSLPTLLLGGGGYNFPNTAKCWTFLTAMAAGKKLPVDIPEHEHLTEYGPSFELTTSKGFRKDCNTKEHFHKVLAQICKNLNSL